MTDELEARTALDDAVHAYSAKFDADGTVGAWVVVYERSALFPDSPEPLAYAHSTAHSIGTSSATVVGMLRLASRVFEGQAVAAMNGDEADG